MDLDIFNNWGDIGEIIFRGIVMFLFTVGLLRIAGKRTVMTLTAFDLVTTVAMGTLLATTVLSVDRPILEGMAAVATFVGLQWITSFVVSRSDTLQRLVINPPKLLIEQGRILHENLDDERISVNQLEQGIRESGETDIGSLTAVTLEASGSFSVIGSGKSMAALKEHQRVDSENSA